MQAVQYVEGIREHHNLVTGESILIITITAWGSFKSMRMFSILNMFIILLPSSFILLHACLFLFHKLVVFGTEWNRTKDTMEYNTIAGVAPYMHLLYIILDNYIQ